MNGHKQLFNLNRYIIHSSQNLSTKTPGLVDLEIILDLSPNPDPACL